MTPAAVAALDQALTAATADALLGVLPLLEVELHGRHRGECTGGHDGGTGHLPGRCSAHGVAMLHVSRRRATFGWDLILGELTRGAAVVDDPRLQAAMHVLIAHAAQHVAASSAL